MKRILGHLRPEQVSGVAIIAAILLGLAAKNSVFEPLYNFAHHARVRIGVESWMSDEPLILWINEGFMTFFFLLVGTELKRELFEGHLANFRQAVLPAYAAVGGMAAPALIYLVLTWTDPASVRGWAIPTATDIVLALGVLTLIGSRVPPALKAFLTALAIIDDIGAVLIIGLFYAKDLFLAPLLVAALAAGGLWILNRYKITRIGPYILAGGTLWLGMLNAGVEAALAGVVIGFAIPMRATSPAGGSPLRQVERIVYPWVALAVVPLFAFFNSGVLISANSIQDLGTPVSLGIISGLFLGKQIGITAVAWAATRIGAAQLPPSVTWPQIYGVSVIAGIGFTMSLFVTTLAFRDPNIVANAKLAILVASLLSGTVGLTILYAATKRLKAAPAGTESARENA